MTETERRYLRQTRSVRTGLTLLLVSLLVACGPSVSYDPLPAGTLVLALGDSITHGTGAPAGADYPARLAQLSRWHIINAGVPGELARDTGARLPGLLAQHNPAMVLLELGGNDFLRQRPATQVKDDLRGLIHTISASGALPVLVAVPRFSMLRATTGTLSDSPVYEELAVEEGIPVVSDALATILSDGDLRADPIHPNAAGYEVLADAIANSLRETGLLR